MPTLMVVERAAGLYNDHVEADPGTAERRSLGGGQAGLLECAGLVNEHSAALPSARACHGHRYRYLHNVGSTLNARPIGLLWRAGLSRVGLRSPPKPASTLLYWGCFAAQRGTSPLATRRFVRGLKSCADTHAAMGSVLRLGGSVASCTGPAQGLACQAAHPFLLVVAQVVEQAVVVFIAYRCIAEHDAL